MTNEYKILNSKNEWKVVGKGDSNTLYRSKNGFVECCNPQDRVWSKIHDNYYVNTYVIEEIVPEKTNLSSLEEMIKNPGVTYETTNKHTGFNQFWKWENNRTLHGIKYDRAEQITWEECLVSTVETAIRNSFSFKKYDSLSDKVQQLSKDVESFGMYVQINPNKRVQVFIQNDYYADNLKRLCERGLIVNDISISFIDDQIKYWSRMKEIKNLIDNQK